MRVGQGDYYDDDVSWWEEFWQHHGFNWTTTEGKYLGRKAKIRKQRRALERQLKKDKEYADWAKDVVAGFIWVLTTDKFKEKDEAAAS